MLSKKVLERIKLMKPFYMKNQLKSIYSWKELENLLNLRPFINDRRIRFITEKEKVFKWKAGGWLTDLNSYPPDILDEEIRKSVCILIDCSRVNKKINLIAEQLENLLKKPVDAHIFFSLCKDKASKKGIGKHNDKSDNLITCVEGKFNVKIFIKDNIVIDKLMKKGDIVFIPAQTDHQITSITDRLSISFPIANNNLDLFQSRKWINI